MKILKYFTFFFIFCLGTDLQAQVFTDAGSSKNRHDNKEIMNRFLKGMERDSNENNRIDGSPYLEKEFTTAELHFPENEPLEAKVRYDVVKEEMQVLFEEDNYRVLHDGVVVEIKNQPFKKFTYIGEDKGQTYLGYLEILTKDYQNKDLLLLEKHYKEVKRGKEAAAMQKARPPKYVDRSDYYLKFKNNRSAVLAERKLKNFLKVFPSEHREEVESFAKQNKLKPKREKDLQAIVNFYNAKF